MHRRFVSQRIALGFAGLIAAVAGSLACSVGGSGDNPKVTNFAFTPLAAGDVLLATDVDAIIAAASQSVDNANLAIVVVDRLGNILRVYNRDGLAASDPTNAFAFAEALASAYLSHSQAPLTSRTGQFLSTFHFPGVFDRNNFSNAPPDAFPPVTLPIQPTLGINNTPQAPLWQIDASNRGGMDDIQADYAVLTTGDPPPLIEAPGGVSPAPGLGPLPGGVPLYKTVASPVAGQVNRRLVGAIGVYATDVISGDPRPDIMEFAAFSGSQAVVGGSDFTFGPIPNEGAVYLVGILLPYIDPPVRPGDQNAGPVHNPALEVAGSGDGAVDGFSEFDPMTGTITNALVGPLDSSNPPFGPNVGDGLTSAEVEAILRGCVRSSRQTHAAIRLPAESACQMIISICDLDGTILGVFREPDATLFSLEISVTKARNAVFFSSPFSRNNDPASPDTTDGVSTVGRHPLFVVFGDGNFGDPDALPLIDETNPLAPGIAVTARSLGFLSQPFFPPTQEGTGIVGPLFSLAQENRDPLKFNAQGFEEAPGGEPAQRSGIIFFPGSAPIYKGGILVGGIGVSGDGVEQDDFVTIQGIRFAEEELGIELEPDPDIRIDNFKYYGVKIPYVKFPQNPGG